MGQPAHMQPICNYGFYLIVQFAAIFSRFRRGTYGMTPVKPWAFVQAMTAITQQIATACTATRSFIAAQPE